MSKEFTRSEESRLKPDIRASKTFSNTLPSLSLIAGPINVDRILNLRMICVLNTKLIIFPFVYMFDWTSEGNGSQRGLKLELGNGRITFAK